MICASFKKQFKQSPWYSIYLKYKRFVIGCLYWFPIDSKKVVFDNFGGRGYGDDPKYIAEYLRAEAKDLKLIWVTQDMETPLPAGIRPVKYGTIRAAFHWATSKVWIDNIKSSDKVRKKKGQFYIQTWHSTLGFKKNEGQVSNLSEKYLEKAIEDAGITDLMYSNNNIRKEIYEKYFWYSGPVLKCGVPRNAVLFQEKSTIKQRVYDYFNIPTTKKILIYAPTFRKKRNLEIYQIDFEKAIQAIEMQFGGEYICLLRLHPNDAEQSDFIEYNDKVLNASGYPDMQELLAVSEVLITDYSGCMFDFSFMKKPVFLYVPDLQTYLQEERMLQFSFDEIPFQRAECYGDLLDCIGCFQNEVYEKKCENFFEKIGLAEDGSGAKTIGDIIIQQCL